MTAASGILHDEIHSPTFTRNGGTLEMVQLWVNLPAKNKMTEPGYQHLGYAQLKFSSGRTTAVVALHGSVTVNGETAEGPMLVLLEPTGEEVLVKASSEATLLILSGEPLLEPIAGRGPFVMNSEAEIRQAILDFRSDSFGRSLPTALADPPH